MHGKFPLPPDYVVVTLIVAVVAVPIVLVIAVQWFLIRLLRPVCNKCGRRAGIDDNNCVRCGNQLPAPWGQR